MPALAAAFSIPEADGAHTFEVGLPYWRWRSGRKLQPNKHCTVRREVGCPVSVELMQSAVLPTLSEFQVEPLARCASASQILADIAVASSRSASDCAVGELGARARRRQRRTLRTSR